MDINTEYSNESFINNYIQRSKQNRQIHFGPITQNVRNIIRTFVPSKRDENYLIFIWWHYFKDNEIDINVTDYILADDNSTGWGINGSYVLLPVAVDDTKSYRDQCSFYPEITQYLESHGRTDTSNITDPLFDTDTQYYTAEDFSDAPESVLRVAKNEIYARHGYIFNDSDMNNYFRGMKWYTPSVKPADFSDSIFNEYEKANLELLKSLQ